MKSVIRKKISRFFTTTTHRKYLYALYYKYGKIQDNVILLESFNGEAINDSSLVFAREIQRLYPGRFKVYFSSSDIKKHKILIDREKLNVELVDVNSVKYLKLLATAKYFISNASIGTFYSRRPGQIFLETWHGTPLKTLGKKMKRGIATMGTGQHSMLQASHLLFPNEFTRKVMMEDYNLERLYTGKVVMSGYPRNQVFLQEGKDKEIRERFGLSDKTVYAYMPTWRGTSAADVNVGDYINRLKGIFHHIDKTMTDDQVFYVNFHQMLKTSIDFSGYKHIKEFPKDVDTYSFLNASDVLVTDYSSVMFDYMLTGKPIVLFMYDYDQYLADRGLYLDINTLPFRLIYKEKDFYDVIKTGSCLHDSYTDTEFYRSFTQYEDVNSPEKLLKMIIEDDCKGIEVKDYSFNKERGMKVFMPQKVDRESDFTTFSEVANDRDSVVLLQRKWLNDDLGQLLYEKYNDSFNYVITTIAYARTYSEMLFSKLGFQGSIQSINDRNMKRCFSELNIKKLVTQYGCFRDGCQIDPRKVVLVQGELSDYGPACLDITIKDKMDMEVESVAVLDEKNTILSKRAPEDEELRTLKFHFDFSKEIEETLFPNKSSASAGLIVKDENGKPKLVKFTDRERAAHIKPKKTSRRMISYDPIYYSCELPPEFMMRKKSYMYLTREESDSLEMQSVSIVPYIDQNLSLSFRVCNDDKSIEYATDLGQLLSISCFGNHMRIKVLMKDWRRDQDSIAGVCLKYISRINEEGEVLLDNRFIEKGDDIILDATLTAGPDTGFKPVNWGAYVKVRYGNSDRYLRIATKSIPKRMSFFFRNMQTDCGDDYMIFPFINTWGTLKFMYRLKSGYDSPLIKAKEILALVISLFARFFLKHNIVIFEKFSNTAQDNSYYFFLYCMTRLPEEKKKHIFYVIDKASPDYQAVKQYDSNVIQFMSLKHMIYAITMEACVSTDAKVHFYAWQSKPSMVFDIIMQKPEMFLQHGVTALKKVDRLFGKHSVNPMKWFVVTSKKEKDLVVREFDYKPEFVPITGFTRWDVLHDKKDPGDRFILMMPTWRAWLEDASNEQFQESEYYQKYVDLITSSELADLLRENGLYVVLYLHPKFAQYIETFQGAKDDLIRCVPFGEEPLNDIMMRAEMLVTDYSSVCWDMMFMNKPVIFYQFDRDKYLTAHGSYIDLEKDLPSDNTTSSEDVIRYLKDYIDNGFRIKDEYKKQVDSFYTFRDTRNSQRTYDYLMHQLEIMK
ncbi:MAG: CDP-glycerol glycerophosphotransferase family protein [Eubacterium sp.]|nr:CDP-glycerol glycerophosphotransferase family protein [Eubacterium sp.]